MAIGHEKLDVYRQHKIELDRIAIMLSCLGGGGYSVREDIGVYEHGKLDFDLDSDFDI